MLIDGRPEFFIDRIGILAGFHPFDRFEHRTGGFTAGEFEHTLHQVGHLFGVFLIAVVLHARSHLAHELLELRLIDVGKGVGGIALAVFEQAFGDCEARDFFLKFSASAFWARCGAWDLHASGQKTVNGMARWAVKLVNWHRTGFSKVSLVVGFGARLGILDPSAQATIIPVSFTQKSPKERADFEASHRVP